MESSYTYGQVKIPHRTMIYLERELAPMEELYKDREKSGGILWKVDYKKLEVFV